MKTKGHTKLKPLSRTFLDIETRPKTLAQLADSNMLPDWWNEEMPEQVHGTLKDPIKIAEWQEKKAREWRDAQLGKKNEWLEKGAFYPERGEVVLVGTLCDGVATIYAAEEVPDHIWNDAMKKVAEDAAILKTTMPLVDWSPAENEAGLAGVVLRHADSYPICGFNIKGFDIPFAVRKFWMCGCRIPKSISSGGKWGPWDKLNVVDLMETWSLGDRSFISLDAVCKYLGIPSKTGSGALFWKMWDEDPAQAIAYNVGDLMRTALVADRLGVQ